MGILAAIAIPRLTGTRDTANRSAVRATLRSLESALSIAEAEGKTITAIGSGTTAGTLVGEGYLASAPSGPGGATYTASSTDRAKVTFATDKTFGFKTTASGNPAAAAGAAYLLTDLLEE